MLYPITEIINMSYDGIMTMPAIRQAQTDDLIADSIDQLGPFRIWRSRMTPEDGERYLLTIERYNKTAGKWYTSIQTNAPINK